MTDRLVPWPEARRLMEGAKGGGGPFDLIDPITWHDKPVPARRWIVEPAIPEGAVTGFYANGGAGKSTLAAQLLACTALGRDWLGLPTRRCKALGVFCEDDEAELHRRMATIVQHYDADLGDLEDLRIASRVGCINAMMTFPKLYEPGEETPFYSDVMNAAVDFGAELVVIDSLHDVFPGNENDRQQVRQFVNSLRSIAMEIKGAVLLIAHPSRAGMSTGTGDSGSTAWSNALRSRFYLRGADPENDGDAEQILEHAKSNYSGRMAPIGLRWRDGVFVANQAPTGVVAHIDRGRAEKAFLACLDRVHAQGRTVSDSNKTDRYAPKVFAKMNEARGLGGVAGLAAAMHRLFDDGRIIVGTTKGPDRHPIKCIMRGAGTAGT